MQPAHVIVLLVIAGTAFFIWHHRQRLRRAVTASVLKVLDAILIAFGAYLLIAIVFDFSAFRSWSGAARVLFFASTPDGAQYFAIFAGCLLGVLRFIQPDSGDKIDGKPQYEYLSGRRIWCHRSALTVANALLANRADKAKSKRPQHLEPGETYSAPPNQDELDAIVRIPDLETNKAVTPYVSAPGEYATVLWGMLRVPYESTTQHFLVAGSTGAGKTVLIHALMRSVLPRIKEDKAFRAFVYDDKLDFVPLARQLELEEYIWSLDPFDDKGFAWDIAADVTTPAEAMQVASVLAPVDPKVPDPYWEQATQDFLSAVLLNFRIVNGDNWSLRDVILSFQSETVLRAVLARDKETESLANFYLSAHSLSDVLAVLSSRLGRYRVPAALYSRAKKKISVRQWHTSNAILLVTGRSLFIEATRPINLAIFRMISILLLNKPDEPPLGNAYGTTQSNWIFLDEIREIGKLEGYHELANKGRSKGVRMVLGFQSIEGMSALHQEDAANEIANICAHRTFLHSDSVKTREWAAQQVGNVVVDETVFNYSYTISKDGWSNTTGHSTQRNVRLAMEASDFDVSLKQATPETGLTALNLIPYIGTYVSHVPWSWIEEHAPQPKDELKIDTPRSNDAQRIGNWNQSDLLRLGLSATILDPPTKKEDKNTDGEEGGGKKKKKASKKEERPVGQSKRQDL